MSNEPATSQSSLDDIVRRLMIERPFADLDHEDALVFFCETIASALKAARVGIWEITADHGRLDLKAMWTRESGEVEPGATLSRNDARSYLDAISEDYVLEIDDAAHDPRCRELARDYLPKHGITAMLDCPIRTYGGLAGVVCIEHVGTIRHWERSEVDFALAITGLVSLTAEYKQRARAERTAAENLDRLKIYTELATDWYWQTDPDFRFTMVEGIPALDGQTPVDYVGRKLWDVPILRPVAATWDDLKGRISGRKRIHDFVVCATDQAGENYYAEIAGIPRRDESGAFVGYWGTAKDVSIRERQRQALTNVFQEKKALLEQLQLVFESCGIGVFRFNGETRLLEFEDSFRKLYAMEAAEPLGPGNFSKELVHPDDREGMEQFIQGAISGPAPFDSHLFRALGPDGEMHNMRSFWKLADTDANGARNIIGLHMDVSDVAIAQQERAKAHEHIAAIAANVPGVLAELNWENGAYRDIVYVSDKCMDLWGFSRGELASDPRPLLQLQDPEHIALAGAAIERSIRTGQQQTHRAPMVARDNTQRWIDFRVQAIAQTDGTHRVFCLFTDVTNEVLAVQEAERQAELAHQSQKNESIGQLTGGVAHDFNNILAVVLGNLELLRDTVEAAGQIELIDSGIEACERGAGLTRSLLAFARKSRLEPVLLDLNDVARQAQNWMRRALPESVMVETSLLAGLWPVKLDSSSIESALLNLILNARDAMDGTGKLTVETANVRIDQAYLDNRNEVLEPGRYVMLAVSDTGSGMDPETQHKIFEPFFSTKPPGKGSGVGLSMVQGFVRQSGGTIQVYSEPGYGTTFKLYFPVSDQDVPDEPRQQPVEPEKPSSKTRILLVEDDDPVRAVLEAMLRNQGYEVVIAKSGDAALERFHQDQGFDLVVTDIVMPGTLQGTHLARELRKTHPDLGFIFLSGYASEATVHGNGLRPEDIRLMKPVRRAEFLNAVARKLAPTTRA